jgi:hypothetical protein
VWLSKAAVLTVPLLLAVALPVQGSNAGATGTWGNAIEVPGTSTLNAGGDSAVLGESCSSSGNCAIIGYYLDGAQNYQAFVDDLVNGTWSPAQEIPGFEALNAGGSVSTTMAISCTGSGSCSAGGSYYDSSNDPQAFVVTESNGTWGSAEEVPGFSSLNSAGAGSGLNALSCSSPGNCSAGGNYADVNGYVQAFITNEVNGTWTTAVEVPGTASLNVNNNAALTAMQCNANGACSASGYYGTLQKQDGTFVVNELQGTWQSAIALPQSNLVSSSSPIDPGAISCSSVGNCALVGSYQSAPNVSNPFVANEIGGTWQNATELQGVNQTGLSDAGLSAVSCSTNGNCSASGYVAQSATAQQGIVASEVNGTWGSALPVPGLSTLDVANDEIAQAISCVSPGNCTTGGFYSAATHVGHAYVADQVNGTWENAIELPGSATLDSGGDGSVFNVVCSADDSCQVSGIYADSSNNAQCLVDSSAAAFFVPEAPKIRAVSTIAKSITVSILGTTQDGGSVITGYQYALNGGAWVNVAVGTSFRIGKLSVAKSYRVQVRAVNAVGDGAASSTLSLKVK